MRVWHVVVKKGDHKWLIRAAFISDALARNYICLQQEPKDYEIRVTPWWLILQVLTELVSQTDEYGLD